MEQNLATEKLTMGTRIKYFFTKPGELFKEYIDKPRIGISFLILGLATIFYTYVTSILTKDLLDKMMGDQFQNMDPQTIEMAKKTFSVLNSPILKVFMALIGLYIGIVIVGLIYWGIISLFKGKISFKQTIAVFCLASMATAIGQILKSIYMLITSKPIIGIESTLKPTTSSVIFNSLDIFTIWYMVLFIIGISTVSGISKKKSAAIVIVLYLIQIGFALFSLSLSKGLA